MRSDFANITTILVQNLVERDKRVHKDKCEDSIVQEYFLLWFRNSGKTKTRIRVRTKIKKIDGTVKNGYHSIGCFNDKQNTWTEVMLLERSTTLMIRQECRLRKGHRDVQLKWRKGKAFRIKENDDRWRISMEVTETGSSVLQMRLMDANVDTITQHGLTWSSYFCIMENVQILWWMRELEEVKKSMSVTRDEQDGKRSNNS